MANTATAEIVRQPAPAASLREHIAAVRAQQQAEQALEVAYEQWEQQGRRGALIHAAQLAAARVLRIRPEQAGTGVWTALDVAGQVATAELDGLPLVYDRGRILVAARCVTCNTAVLNQAWEVEGILDVAAIMSGHHPARDGGGPLVPAWCQQHRSQQR